MEHELDASDLADAMVIEPEDADDKKDEDVDDTGKDQDTDDSEDNQDDPDKDGDQDDPIKSLRAEISDIKKTAEKERATLDKKVAGLEKENKRLGYQLRKADKGGNEDKEDVFTDAQLLQMMKDHADDPAVLFQVMKQMNKQSGDSVAKTAEAKADVKAKRKELEEISEKVFPGVLKDDSPIHDGIQQTMSNYGLSDHPYGDVLSLGIMTITNLPSMIENAKKHAQKQGLGKAADAKRKDKIKANNLADKGSKSTPIKLSPGANETAKSLNMNKRQKELYQKFLKAGKKAAVVQAGA